MSESDSFIDEVSEEVRKDTLVRYFNKHRWTVVGVLVLIVAAVAYNEYARSAAQKRAQAVGDEMIVAIEAETPEEQIEALTQLSQNDAVTSVVARLQLAAAQARAEDKEAAAATLQALADDADADPLYRDTARLKLVMLQGSAMPMDARMAIVQDMIIAGGPLRPLASEQRGLAYIDAGDIEAAVAEFVTLSQDIDASEQLRQRALQMVTALGGAPEDEEQVDQ